MNVGLFFFALLSASFNALLSFGQKKADPIGNKYLFFAVTSFVFFVLNLIAGLLVQKDGIGKTLLDNRLLPWEIVCGVAFFGLYAAFNTMIIRYGASSYAIYSVISVFFTAVVVGAFYFKEKLNLYHWGGIFLGLCAVALFAIGNTKR